MNFSLVRFGSVFTLFKIGTKTNKSVWIGRLIGLFKNIIKKKSYSNKFVFRAYNIHHTKIFHETLYFILCFFMFSIFQTTFYNQQMDDLVVVRNNELGVVDG